MTHISNVSMVTEIESIPAWLLELADDLDVYVAQRDFEEAVSLIERNRAFWENASPTVSNLHRDLKFVAVVVYCLVIQLTYDNLSFFLE